MVPLSKGAVFRGAHSILIQDTNYRRRRPNLWCPWPEKFFFSRCGDAFAYVNFFSLLWSEAKIAASDATASNLGLYLWVKAFFLTTFAAMISINWIRVQDYVGEVSGLGIRNCWTIWDRPIMPGELQYSYSPFMSLHERWDEFCSEVESVTFIFSAWSLNLCIRYIAHLAM